jgi:hypothetical protein
MRYMGIPGTFKSNQIKFTYNATSSSERLNINRLNPFCFGDEDGLLESSISIASLLCTCVYVLMTLRCSGLTITTAVFFLNLLGGGSTSSALSE